MVAGAIGNNRTAGFWGTFIASLVLSPIIGLIIALASRSNAQVKYEMEMKEQQRVQTEALQNMQPKSVADELAQLKTLFDQGAITGAQYDAAVKKVTGAD